MSTTDRTMTVQGRGHLSQAPDRIRILLTVSGSDPDFARAVFLCNVKTDALHAAAAACSIPKADLKTGRFSVREETAYDGRKHVHQGFQATHELAVLLPVDQEAVGKFLSQILRGRAQPQVGLRFEVADATGLRQRVLAEAVKNAKDNAETIALATGVALGSVLSIHYGYSEVRISSQLSDMAMEACMGEGDVAPEFEPTDIEIKDTVKITWEIARQDQDRRPQPSEP